MPSIYEIARQRSLQTPVTNVALAVDKPRRIKRTGLHTKGWQNKKVADLTPEQLDERHAYFKEYYHLNEERERERKRKNEHAYRMAHKDEINERRRKRYAEDPEFRKKRLGYGAKQRAKRKALREDKE